MEQQDGPQWLTTEEVAKRWRMSGRTLERWRADGHGPDYVRLGGRVVYEMSEIEDYVRRNRCPGR